MSDHFDIHLKEQARPLPKASIQLAPQPKILPSVTQSSLPSSTPILKRRTPPDLIQHVPHIPVQGTVKTNQLILEKPNIIQFNDSEYNIGPDQSFHDDQHSDYNNRPVDIQRSKSFNSTLDSSFHRQDENLPYQSLARTTGFDTDGYRSVMANRPQPPSHNIYEENPVLSHTSRQTDHPHDHYTPVVPQLTAIDFQETDRLLSYSIQLIHHNLID
jgi:hypothetical protein